MWTDDQRRCINGYQFIPSVRQGVPPQGIEASIMGNAIQSMVGGGSMQYLKNSYDLNHLEPLVGGEQ